MLRFTANLAHTPIHININLREWNRQQQLEQLSTPWSKKETVNAEEAVPKDIDILQFSAVTSCMWSYIAIVCYW